MTAIQHYNTDSTNQPRLVPARLAGVPACLRCGSYFVGELGITGTIDEAPAWYAGGGDGAISITLRVCLTCRYLGAAYEVER